MGSYDERKNLEMLERKRCEALLSRDIEALGSLLADDLVHIHGNGEVDRRPSYLEGVAHKYRFHRLERGKLDIRIYKDVAVMTGSARQAVSIIGIDKINHIDAMITQTWIRREAGWQQNTCHMHFLATNGKSLL